MKYLQAVMEQEQIGDLISNDDNIIAQIVEKYIPIIINYNSELIKEELVYFTEDSLVDTYDNISSFVREDIEYFLESVSLLYSDKVLIDEDKDNIFNESTAVATLQQSMKKKEGLGRRIGKAIKRGYLKARANVKYAKEKVLNPIRKYADRANMDISSAGARAAAKEKDPQMAKRLGQIAMNASRRSLKLGDKVSKSEKVLKRAKNIAKIRREKNKK